MFDRPVGEVYDKLLIRKKMDQRSQNGKGVCLTGGCFTSPRHHAVAGLRLD